MTQPRCNRFWPALLGVLLMGLIPWTPAQAEIIISRTPAQAASRALLIGISDYQQLPFVSKDLVVEYKDLNGPRNDVRLLREALISRDHLPPEAIRVLTDREATREAILTSVESWLIQGSRPGDLVLFYFSGIGVQVPDQNGDEDDGVDEALAAYDMILKGKRARTSREAGLILDDELGELFRRLQDRQVVVILDTCFSVTETKRSSGISVVSRDQIRAIQQGHREGGAQEPAVAPSLPGERPLPQPDISIGHIWLTASRENQLAVEKEVAPGVYNGAFTHALVEGMMQQRDRTYRDLYEYVREVIRDRYNLEQEPQIVPSSGKLLEQRAFTPGAVVLPQVPTR